MIRNANKFEKEAQCSTWDLAYKSLHGTKLRKAKIKINSFMPLSQKTLGGH